MVGGIVVGLIILLCGGCASVKTDTYEYNSPFEDFAKIFKPSEHVGPIVGEEARYARAKFIARTTGDVSLLNKLAWEDYLRGDNDERSRGVDDFGRKVFRNPRLPRYYSYFGRIYEVPPKGTTAYETYLRRTKKSNK